MKPPPPPRRRGTRRARLPLPLPLPRIVCAAVPRRTCRTDENPRNVLPGRRQTNRLGPDGPAGCGQQRNMAVLRKLARPCSPPPSSPADCAPCATPRPSRKSRWSPNPSSGRSGSTSRPLPGIRCGWHARSERSRPRRDWCSRRGAPLAWPRSLSPPRWCRPPSPHAFWTVEDPQERALQRAHFLTDLSALGGLLIAAADTHGKPSLAYRSRHALDHRHPVNAVRRPVEAAAARTTHHARVAAAALTGSR